MKNHILLLLLFFTINLSAQDIVGSWSGVLDVGVAQLRLQINIEKGVEGYKATMDSPDQGAKGIVVSKISFEGNILELNIEAIQMSYRGEVEDESIVGTFTQRGNNLPLLLTKGKSQEINRPQNPKEPFSYNSEEVKFYNQSAGINLAGTFTYPKVGSNFPVVILITGSGPQNRDEEIMGHKPFLVLSDYLTNHGIAVLRFDDRGVGKSEGDFAKATSTDFATDAYAGIQFLKSRKDVNKNKIGLLGHSEGGLIAFMLGGKYLDEISFIVSMAGTGVTGRDILFLQSKATLLAEGASQYQALENQKILQKLLPIIEKYDTEYLKENIESIMFEVLPVEQHNEESMTLLRGQIAQMSSPWYRQFLSYNPIYDLQKVTAHVFALNGDKDCQVDAEQNLTSIDNNLFKTKSKKIKKYPNLNHLFQTSTKGAVSEYGMIEETIAPEVLKDISDWINEVSK